MYIIYKVGWNDSIERQKNNNDYTYEKQMLKKNCVCKNKLSINRKFFTTIIFDKTLIILIIYR